MRKLCGSLPRTSPGFPKIAILCNVRSPFAFWQKWNVIATDGGCLLLDQTGHMFSGGRLAHDLVRKALFAKQIFLDETISERLWNSENFVLGLDS